MKIFNSINRTFTKVGMKVIKHSPEILVVVGVAGTVYATVKACKATLKLDETIEENKKLVDKIRENEDIYDNETEYKKDLTIAYAKTGVAIAKLYGPSLTIGTASIAAIFGSHHILSTRNAALASAYALIEKGYKEYRKRVINELGEDMDRHFRFNTKLDTITETTVGKNGKEKTTTETVEVVDILSQYSDFAKFFDESCPEWNKDPEYNLTFLKMQENYFNNRLQSRGIVFLNEVYEALGFEKTKAGQIAGWLYRPEDTTRDNYISFGIYNQDSKAARRFVNGVENVILLDFNVDGDILSEM